MSTSRRFSAEQSQSLESWLALFRRIQPALEGPPSLCCEEVSIAGLDVRMSFGSTELGQALFSAFAHLRHNSAGSPALSIMLHDISSTPIASDFMNAVSQMGSDNEIWLADRRDLTIIVQAHGRVVSVIDWREGKAYWLCRSPQEIPYLERAGPLRHLLCRWLGERDRYFAHAAAVGHAGSGALILGESGSGKSTTALTCLNAGLAYAGDDHCIVSINPEPIVYSLFSAGKLDVAEWRSFPALVPAGDLSGRPPGEKGLFFLNTIPGLCLVRSLPIHAVLLARITDRTQTALFEVDPTQAFKSLVPSNALHFERERSQALKCFSALARQVPAYRLELGSDWSSTPAAISELLAKHADRGAVSNA
jgi:hypothetical protein